jgi:hypothetical protein
VYKNITVLEIFKVKKVDKIEKIEKIQIFLKLKNKLFFTTNSKPKAN